MQIIQTELQGLVEIMPQVFEDKRGYFFESYNEQKFIAAGITAHFVQDNQSHSTRGVLRGLHYQLPPYAQAKLVRVLQGEVLDVAVDIRKGSPTFGKHACIHLSGEKKNMAFIPRGFAHGFVVLSAIAVFFYKCDNFYNKESEGGIIYNDIELDIDWQMDVADLLVSEKDMALPDLKNCKNTFEYVA